MYQKWLERIDNLLQVQKDNCLDLIAARFTRRELIELKMMIETLKVYKAETLKSVINACYTDSDSIKYLKGGWTRNDNRRRWDFKED